MRTQIERLTAENWRCHKALDMAIAPRMICVSEDPGPGKSTILDAVVYAALGNCRGTGMTGQGSESLRMHGTDAANVELGIKDDEGPWQLGRRIGKSGGPYLREDGGAKQSGIHLRFEQAFGIPAPAVFPSVRSREFLEMSKEEREKIVLTACGTFRVSAMIERAGELWPEGWENADVLKLLGNADPMTIKDGMQRIHNKAVKARQLAAREVADAEAKIAALSEAAEDVVPDVKPPSEQELKDAQTAVKTARDELDALEERQRARAPLEQTIRELGEPPTPVGALRARYEQVFGRKGKLVPQLQAARGAIAEMNNGRAQQNLPPVHKAEDLGEPPEADVLKAKIAEHGCPYCQWAEQQPNVPEKCPFTVGHPQLKAHLDAHGEGVQATYRDALQILTDEAALRDTEREIDAEVKQAEDALDAAKRYGKQLDAANEALAKLGEPVETEAILKARGVVIAAEAQVSDMTKAAGAGGAAKGVKAKATAAKRARTKADTLRMHWANLEHVADPAGELARLWMADLGIRFVEQLPKASAMLAPSEKLPEGVDPIKAWWEGSECHIARYRDNHEVMVPWRLASRGEQKFGELAVAVTWAMVTGCLLVVGDDVDALGNLLPVVLDGLYGTGTSGNVLLAGVGATMARGIEQAETGEQWAEVAV